jgi:hypothetical protein
MEEELATEQVRKKHLVEMGPGKLGTFPYF